MDSSVDFTFATTRTNGPRVLKMDVTPDGSKLVIIGNFTEVGGHARTQLAVIDLAASPAALDAWNTSRYGFVCNDTFPTYMRDVDISPDGSYFVIVTTGSYRSPPRLCDTAVRWEFSAAGADKQPTWVSYTGGDTLFSTAVTGSAVYIGGHQRWANNAYAADKIEPGAVARDGIAALDPQTGLPFSWNPGRTRGVGVFDMVATADGLWVGSDTEHIGWNAEVGGYEYHPRVAYFPLAGGSKIPPARSGSLPGDVLLLGPTGTATKTDTVLRRGFTGTSNGTTTTVPGSDGGGWSSVRGAFLLSGTLYTGMSDGRLLYPLYAAKRGSRPLIRVG